jgi:hypothetical protein
MEEAFEDPAELVGTQSGSFSPLNLPASREKARELQCRYSSDERGRSQESLSKTRAPRLAAVSGGYYDEFSDFVRGGR